MDERLKVYEEKMTKSYDAMIREFTAIRAGRAACTGQAEGRLLRNPDPDSAGW